MTSKLIDRRDLDFVLFDLLGAEELFQRPRFAEHDRAGAAAILDLAESIAADHFATHNKKADQNEPRFENGQAIVIPEVSEALARFREAGFFGATAEAAEGGLQLPLTIANAAMAMFQAANVGTTAYPFLTIGARNLLKAHGTPDLTARFLSAMTEGRFFGTMCLSEPQAGSSLADITTRAEPQADGTYRLFGRKMWISAGEHELSDNIVHMVLAKMPGAPAGAKGISLFLTPKYLLNDDGSIGARNDVTLAGLNHKMGYRGTTNCLLNFGEGAFSPQGAPGAVGYLVGAPHQGLAAMFLMMNEARIGVGLGATALGYAGYQHALDYAKSRPQGRPLGAKDPTTPQVPIIAHPDVRRLLLSQKAFVEGALAFVLYCARLVDDGETHPDSDKRAEAGLLLELLTPIAKSWPSSFCLAANDMAIQVHGGYGYTRDYMVEQLYRDNRLNPIHEGTHGVQALDLMGRKLGLAGGKALHLFLTEVEASAAQGIAAGGALARHGGALKQACADIARIAAQFRPDMLEKAAPFLDAFGHVAIAWIWLRQALLLQGREDDFARGKRAACAFFFDWELPKIAPVFALLDADDWRLSALDAAVFG